MALVCRARHIFMMYFLNKTAFDIQRGRRLVRALIGCDNAVRNTTMEYGNNPWQRRKKKKKEIKIGNPKEITFDIKAFRGT